MEQTINSYSKTDIEIRQRIKFIYQHLIKLGYPKILELSLQKIQEIEIYLATYFQSTPSRLQLIEWLIAVICPEYRQMTWYITEKDQLNKIIKSLWKVGVMPVNKHTKNLDYKKYVQAMLGYQNSVNLIYNLTQLAFQTVLTKKSKNDVSFGMFFHDLINNYTQLVNQNYDIYGITFPCKFVNPNQALKQDLQENQKEDYIDEFNKQYNEFYTKKMIPLLEKEDIMFDKIYEDRNKKQQLIQSSSKKNHQVEFGNQQDQNQSELGSFIEKLGKYGKQYHDKYQKLVKNIENLLDNPKTKSRLIPFYLNKKLQNTGQMQQKTVKQNIEARSIRISPQFCKKYKEYKKILRQIKVSKDDKQFMQKRTLIVEELQKINDNISL